MVIEQDTHRDTRKPIVAIVGRPNVGKSTLFNRIIGFRKSIVEDIPGVTRDRIYSDCEWWGVDFTLVDTGGFDPESDDFYLSMIKEQVKVAIEEAELILFVMDSTTGVMPQDREVMDILRKSAKPVLYVLNKVDHDKHEMREYDFHSLGVDRFYGVSAVQGRNIYELLDAVVEKLPEVPWPADETEEEGDGIIRVAMVGKPNVGKSTLINKILGEERLLVSPKPGTTRDSVDSLVEFDGKSYLFVDTAGVRKKARVSVAVERYSVLRTIRTIERSHVIVLMIDSQEGPTHQDARLAELIELKGRASVIVLNKWDLVPDALRDTRGIDTIVREGLHAIRYSPVLTLSALTGKRVHKLFDLIDAAYANYSHSISTRELNNLLKEAVSATPAPLYNGRPVKFYYISQTRVRPPTMVMFANTERGVPENYRRFIENRLRDKFNLEGTPVRLIIRSKREG